MPELPRCACNSMYRGCDHPIPCPASVTDNRWGPWCMPCNKERLAHIKQDLTDIRSHIEEKPNAWYR